MDNLYKMVVFVLKNNFFEFNRDVKQVLGKTNGTKFAPHLQSQEFQSLKWLRYIDDNSSK